MAFQYDACNLLLRLAPMQSSSNKVYSIPTVTRRKALSTFTLTTVFYGLSFSDCCCRNYSWSKTTISDFVELPNSGGVKSLDLRFGDGETPANGDKVAIHYYGRLAAKQGWRFDSTYDHKDKTGEPIPFEFFLGSGKVISGIDSAIRSMKVGGIRRVIIPPSEGYQNTSQEPVPPNMHESVVGYPLLFVGFTVATTAIPVISKACSIKFKI